MLPGNALRARVEALAVVPRLHACLPGAALAKKAKPRRGRALKPVRFERPATRKAVQRMTRALVAGFRAIKPKLIAQVVARVTALTKDKPDASMIDEIMAGLDFTTFDELPKRVRSMLEDVFGDAGELALGSVGVAVRAARGSSDELSPDAFDQVSDFAVSYARDRSAEMVGMRYGDDGEVEQNPDARWAITDTTRDGIRSAVADVVEGRASVTDLADNLADSYDFSPERAQMIARTEMRMANGAGAIAGYKASGVVEMKVWLTAGDDAVSEDCQENEDAGPVALDAAFPSGDDAEPAHPNCRCVTAPYIDFSSGDETSEEGE